MPEFPWWALFAVMLCPLYFAAAVMVLRSVQMVFWRRSLCAFELRIPQDTKADDVARWVGSLRAVLRARRWWSVFPRWPIGLETVAGPEGIMRLVLVPRRLRGDVLATLSAVMPGARLTEKPDHQPKTAPRGRSISAEAHVKGAAELLASGRSEDVSRHVLAAL